MNPINNEKAFSYTGERLVQDKKILKPQRVENLTRFNFFRQHISSGRILDYGCGTGEGTHFLSTFEEYEVTGVDISLCALTYAMRYYTKDRLTFVCGDVLSPSFQNDIFDGIISVEVIEHLTDPDLYLRNVTNLLKTDGIFMLTTPNQLVSSPTSGSLWPDHVREFSANDLADLLFEFFNKVDVLAEYIPIYEENSFRKLIKKFAPFVKPILPKWLRVRALPFLFTMIKSEIKMEDVVFTSEEIDQYPTLVAICSSPRKSIDNYLFSK